ncbi:hypothetical protein KEM56_007093 [Ascosphaera pollenicola]|nr:hypothetical protein KEM56_007093 [Ascosphaera pollenicola]
MIGRYLFKHTRVSTGLWWGYIASLTIRLGFAAGLLIISCHSFKAVKQLISKFGPVEFLLSPLEIPVMIVIGIGGMIVASTLAIGLIRLLTLHGDQKAALWMAIGKRGLGSMISDTVSDTVSDKILDKVAENEHLKHLCSKLRLLQVFSILLAAVTGIILLVNLAEYAGAKYDRKREEVQTASTFSVRTEKVAAEQQHVQEEHNVGQGQGGNSTEGQRRDDQPTGQNSDPSAFETLRGTFISR